MSDTFDIAVLCGGPSPEAEVSRKSGAAIAAALQRRGHRVRVVEADRAGLAALAANPPECAWLATHGQLGEDGSLQGFCEVLGIPYTGSGVGASAIAMDKLLTRQMLRAAGVKQPRWLTANLATAESFRLPPDWSLPVIVKPSNGGSSLGTNLVKNAEDLNGAIYAALKYGDVALVEQFLVGRELSVGVFESEVLGDIEIIPEREFYDYEAKYKNAGTRYVVAPELSDEVRAELHRQALEAAQMLGCEGAIRIDFFLVGKNDLFFMEVNTIPGMTESSLLPKIAAHAGVTFDDLVERVAWQARLKCA